MSLPKIMVVISGQPPPSVAPDHGSYFHWFQVKLGPNYTCIPWYVSSQSTQPALQQFAGIIISGSESSMTSPKPWMEIIVEMIREASDGDIPVLGIAFGHQLIGAAFGAPTIFAPSKKECGSCRIRLNAKGMSDPLFQDIPEDFHAFTWHSDQVDPSTVMYSNGLQVLASSSNTEIQALAAGNSIRSVQFHPEFTHEIMTAYLLTHEQQKHITNQSCLHASKILDNWKKHWL